MLLPTSIAIGSVLLGWVLGVVGRREAASRVTASALSTFALVAALAVVLAHLLPDALGAAGLPALFVFAGAAALPTIIKKLASGLGRNTMNGRVGLELGYAGLLVHKAADGVGLGTYGAGEHAGHGHFDVLFAIAAHTVPLVAVLTISFHRDLGMRSSVLRIAGLAVATLVGVFATAAVPEQAHSSLEPWVTAAVAGLLLHVVAHDFRPEERPRGLGARLIDLLAVTAGLGLVLLGNSHGHDHGGGGGEVRAEMAAALLDLSLETAPALLFGLLVGALLTTFGRHLPMRWLASGGSLRQAVRGAIVGAPLPICACGVLPLAASLKKRGAGAALVVAFLVSTPELGVETFALTARFVGWPFALVRLGAAVLLAIVAALVVHRAAAARPGTFDGAIVEPSPASDPAPIGRRLIASFDELLYHVAPWTVVGLIAAAYVQAVLPSDALGGLRAYGLDVLLVAVVAVPSYVCAASATPLAAVLLLKGMSPGAVLIGLLLGPATNIATVGFLKQSYGARATALGLGSLVLAAIGLAFVVNGSGLPLDVSATAVEGHEHSVLAIVCGALLSIALLRSIWQAGLRPWLASLGESLNLTADHSHDHGHAHDHAHHDHAH